MTGFTLSVLGAPALTAADGRFVRFLSRKSQALFLYVALQHGKVATRERLSGLLWGGSDEQRARASLRQGLRQLAAIPTHGGSLVSSDRNSVWIEPGVLSVDVEEMATLLETPTVRTLERAAGMIRGPVLDGAELGEEGYDAAIGDHRCQIGGWLVARLEGLVAAADGTDGEVMRLAELGTGILATLEPANDLANRWAIERAIALGRTDKAVMLFERYRRRLASDLDLEPPADLAARVAAIRRGLRDAARPPSPDGRRAQPARAGRRSSVPAVTPALGGAAGDLGQPRFAIVRPAPFHALPDLFGFAVDEVLFQLSRFRDLRIFQHDGGDGGARVAISDESAPDYRLELNCHPSRRTIHLAVLDAHSRELIIRERLAPEAFSDRRTAEVAIARCVNALEVDVLARHRTGRGRGTTYGRWLDAFSLMSAFDPAADERALSRLETMAEDPVDRRLSLVHSSIGSILMKRRLMAPGFDRERQALDRAQGLARAALAIDPLEPFNHVILGWSLLQKRNYHAGLAAFDDALALNPFSARTNMAAAEAYGYAGELDKARGLASRAMSLMEPRAPAYFFAYLARIEYMAGEPARCLALLERAPRNAETEALRVAAQAQRGALDEAAAHACRLLNQLERCRFARPDPDAVAHWVAESAIFRDQAVRSSWLEVLARAGLPVDARLSGQPG